MDLKEIIIGCIKFPNVPLMGTRGGINYNPILARHQLGFRMMDRPTEHGVMDTIYFGKGEYADLLERVKMEWEHILHKGKLSFSQNGRVAYDTYTSWIQDRVKEIRLLYKRGGCYILNLILTH